VSLSVEIVFGVEMECNIPSIAPGGEGKMQNRMKCKYCKYLKSFGSVLKYCLKSKHPTRKTTEAIERQRYCKDFVQRGPNEQGNDR